MNLENVTWFCRRKKVGAADGVQRRGSSSRATGALSLGRLWGLGRFLEDRLYLHQDSMAPGLLSRQDAPQVALVNVRYARQAKRHANVAVRWTLAMAHARRPDKLLRGGTVEPWNIDADTQPGILAWMGSCAS